MMTSSFEHIVRLQFNSYQVIDGSLLDVPSKDVIQIFKVKYLCHLFSLFLLRNSGFQT